MALLKVSPGDVVAIPAVNGAEHGFVLSRVIRETKMLTIEVFRDFHTDFGITEGEVRAQDFSLDNRLFSPVYASFDFGKYFGKVKWPILLSDPHYDREQSRYSEIEIMAAPALYDEFGRYYRGGKECQEPPGVRRNLEDSTIYSNPQLVHRINLHLSGFLARGEPLNARRVRAAVREKGDAWWDNGVKECIDIADAIAAELNAAQKKSRKIAAIEAKVRKGA